MTRTSHQLSPEHKHRISQGLRDHDAVPRRETHQRQGHSQGERQDHPVLLRGERSMAFLPLGEHRQSMLTRSGGGEDGPIHQLYQITDIQ